MNIAAPSKDQGASIRPVYVGADDNDETKPVDDQTLNCSTTLLLQMQGSIKP